MYLEDIFHVIYHALLKQAAGAPRGLQTLLCRLEHRAAQKKRIGSRGKKMQAMPSEFLDPNDAAMERAATRVAAVFRGLIGRKRAQKQREWQMRTRNQQLMLGQGGQTRQAYAIEMAAEKRRQELEQVAEGRLPRRGKMLSETGAYLNIADGAFEDRVRRTIPGYKGYVPFINDNIGTTFAAGGARSYDTYHARADPSERPVAEDYVPCLHSAREAKRREDRGVPCRNSRVFIPATMRTDVEGDEAQRRLRHLGTHQRAPFGVDDTRELEGKIYYKSVAHSGPGSWYAQQLREERRKKMDITFDAALAYGRAQRAEKRAAAQASATQLQERAAADHVGPVGGSMASRAAHRRLGRANGAQ